MSHDGFRSAVDVRGERHGSLEELGGEAELASRGDPLERRREPAVLSSGCRSLACLFGLERFQATGVSLLGGSAALGFFLGSDDLALHLAGPGDKHRHGISSPAKGPSSRQALEDGLLGCSGGKAITKGTEKRWGRRGSPEPVMREELRGEIRARAGATGGFLGDAPARRASWLRRGDWRHERGLSKKGEGHGAPPTHGVGDEPRSSKGFECGTEPAPADPKARTEKRLGPLALGQLTALVITSHHEHTKKRSCDPGQVVLLT